MWMFTPEGFFSIVAADEFGEEIQVRSRSADDIDRLRNSYFAKLGDTVSIKHRDYPFRAFTTRSDLAECLSQMALSIDYSNFKTTVARRHSQDRAHTYAKVWGACLEIENESVSSIERPPKSVVGPRSDAYRSGDLTGWPVGVGNRYGGVVFNERGEVLLREPRNHFDQYHWTFSKGAPNKGEHPVDAALRETYEETGHRTEIIGHLPKGYGGTSTGWSAYYFVMVDVTGPVGTAPFDGNPETQRVTWASLSEARELVSETRNVKGRERDMSVLEDAFSEFEKIRSR